MPAGPFPTKQMHEDLKGRVKAIEQGGGGAAVLSGGIPGAAFDGMLFMGLSPARTFRKIVVRTSYTPTGNMQLILGVNGTAVAVLNYPAGTNGSKTTAISVPVADGDEITVALSGSAGASDVTWMVG